MNISLLIAIVKIQLVETRIKKKKRNRLPMQEKWSDNKNKKLRQEGKAYRGWSRPKNEGAKRGTEKEARKLGPRCVSKLCSKSKTRKCFTISESVRQELFEKFWSDMNWDQKKVYISSLVTKLPIARSTKSGETLMRTGSLKYSIKTPDGQILSVCKKFFLSTFGLKEWTVNNWASNSSAGCTHLKMFLIHLDVKQGIRNQKM